MTARQPQGLNAARTLRIGMLGCGVVGAGVVKLIEKHRADFVRNGFDLCIARVAVRDAAKARDVDLAGARITSDAMAVARADDIDLLVEVMGGADTAVLACCTALERGIPVVTANKAALARNLGRFAEAAARGRASIGFEAAAAAHIPIIEVLERNLACEEITLVKGVINGSTNYILTFMERAGCEYPEALADAAAKGFTEADPRLDVEGIDAAEKLCLLAFKGFGASVHPDRVRTTGITAITQADIRLALAMDHRIKLVASARRTAAGITLNVHPALVHRGELLADVDSEFNAIILEGPGFNQLTFLGKGAGQLPTASAVLNDIVRLARYPGAGSLPGFLKGTPETALGEAADSPQCFFVRVRIRPGTSEPLVSSLRDDGLPVLNHAVASIDGTEYLGIITDTIPQARIIALMQSLGSREGAAGAPAFIRLDKDNYRDIVEREQTAYFGASIQRQPGPRV